MMKLNISVILGLLLLPVALSAEEPDTYDTILQASTTNPGYITYHWDSSEGKVYLEIERFDEDFLYVSSLSQGLGSNDIGLDRGQLGGSHVVHFERIGNKVLLVEPNLDYRALSDDPAERAAVEQAFAKSVLWGFTVEAEQDGNVIVDATDFLLRDAHNVTGSLSRTEQGSFSLDESRSAINLDRTKNFERNTEFDAMLTYTGEAEGAWLRSITPTSHAFTIHQHHSFVELPDDNYTPRAFDPRSGSFGISFYDYATPIDQPLEKKWVARHRLEKKDPTADISEAVEPIIYYLDPGTPEPVRSALLDGTKWWNQAFEAIGYRDAFQVKMLPIDADPLDLNYNVIQWVHRRTRGWSYGSTVTDPRTGEIIKGHVSLGSLRVRQDFLIAQALTAPYTDANADTTAIQELALARLRQLAAHEVGHTIGFAHNFAASIQNRASVMDYPHPNIQLDDQGNIDLSDAYDTDIGEWDKVTVAYAYSDFPKGTDEAEALQNIITDSLAQGWKFISDQDARPFGGSHPYAHLWDSGSDSPDELLRVLEVRAKALDNFSENNIPVGTPMAQLEDVLVPLYLFHRYQTEATAKLIGGVDYSYAVRGDGQLVTELIDGQTQRKAFHSLMRTLDVDALTLPDHILKLIPPRVYGARRHRELFENRTGPTLDPLSMAEAAADQTLSLLLHPARASRLVEQHARDAGIPGLDPVLQLLIRPNIEKTISKNLNREVHRVINERVVQHLIQLAADTRSTPQVRAITIYRLEKLNQFLEKDMLQRRTVKAIVEDVAHYQHLANLIQQFLDTPHEYTPEPTMDLPPGSPIGEEWCSFDRR